MNNAHTTKGNIVTSGTPIRRVNKRWRSFWGASLATLILTGGVLSQALAAPPIRKPIKPVKPGCALYVAMNEAGNYTESCTDMALKAATKMKLSGGSESDAQQTYMNVKDKCLECRK